MYFTERGKIMRQELTSNLDYKLFSIGRKKYPSLWGHWIIKCSLVVVILLAAWFSFQSFLLRIPLNFFLAAVFVFTAVLTQREIYLKKDDYIYIDSDGLEVVSGGKKESLRWHSILHARSSPNSVLIKTVNGRKIILEYLLYRGRDNIKGTLAAILREKYRFYKGEDLSRIDPDVILF